MANTIAKLAAEELLTSGLIQKENLNEVIAIIEEETLVRFAMKV